MKYTLVTKTEQLDEIHIYARKHGAFAFDVETTGDNRSNPRLAPVTWLSIATQDKTWVIPMGHPNGKVLLVDPELNSAGVQRKAKHMIRHGRGLLYEEYNPNTNFKTTTRVTFGPPPEQLSRAQVFTLLEPLFFDEDLVKIGHNVKFDLHAVTKYYGRAPAAPYYDTLVGVWLLDPNKVTRRKLNLKDCAADILKRDVEKGVGENVALHSFDEVARYSAIDAQVTWDLYVELERRFKIGGRKKQLLRDLEMSVLEPSLEMEATGTRIDLPLLEEIGKDFLDMAEASKMTAIRMVGPLNGKPFNVASNKQKQEVLYGRLGLRPTILTPGGQKKQEAGEELTIYDYSVNHEALSAMEKEPVVSFLLQFQKYSKLHGTYVLPYTGGEVTKDGKVTVIPSGLEKGRIHGSFKQHGTESGRFSSSNPNLQNIPNRSTDGRRLREVFIADEGCVLVVADYSQIEPRIIASLSGDKTMVRTYHDGGDVYQVVADRLGVERPVGKELVLSIAYGIGPTTIASRTGMSTQQARDLMSFFTMEFSAVPKHRAKVINQARLNKYAVTVTGRRRPLLPFRHPRSFGPQETAKAERQAYNHHIQGSAADVMKLALVGIYDALPEEARLLMTVHDEVVVQAPENMAEDVAKIVKEEMELAGDGLFTVPMVAEVGMGHRWADAH